VKVPYMGLQAFHRKSSSIIINKRKEKSHASPSRKQEVEALH
jgi:hypothetical protein